jgi:hypothetical protein
MVRRGWYAQDNSRQISTITPTPLANTATVFQTLMGLVVKVAIKTRPRAPKMHVAPMPCQQGSPNRARAKALTCGWNKKCSPDDETAIQGKKLTAVPTAQMLIAQAVLLEKNILRAAKTCFITMPRPPTAVHSHTAAEQGIG